VDIDVAVVGGGIAGMSVAAELSRESGMRIALFERETQLAYHASGRSAAAFMESYGSPEIRALTRASRPTLDAGALLSPRPAVWLAPPGQEPTLRALIEAEPLVRQMTDEELRTICPMVRPGWATMSAIEDDAQDLDVAGLFDRYRREALINGVTVQSGVSIVDGSRDGTGWLLHTDSGTIRCAAVVNAAGAWADDLAQRCGLAPLGLTPLRRTVAVVSVAGLDRGWPLVGDISESFYFRPEGDALLLSPADETPTAPVDARAEMEDVALALDRANEATTLNLRHVRTTWAGLRTFSPDRNPVVGPDPVGDGFLWLAGQGGYGMQTAPAMASLAAALVLGRTPAIDGLDPTRLAPARFF
jgi:D-arginine dehydrogenase